MNIEWWETISSKYSYRWLLPVCIQFNKIYNWIFEFPAVDWFPIGWILACFSFSGFVLSTLPFSAFIAFLIYIIFIHAYIDKPLNIWYIRYITAMSLWTVRFFQLPLCILLSFFSHTIWPQQKCWLSFCTFNSFEQCKVCCMFGQMKTWKIEMNKYGSEFLCVRIPFFFSCNIHFCCWFWFSLSVSVYRFNIKNASNWCARLHQMLRMAFNSRNHCRHSFDLMKCIQNDIEMWKNREKIENAMSYRSLSNISSLSLSPLPLMMLLMLLRSVKANFDLSQSQQTFTTFK